MPVQMHGMGRVSQIGDSDSLAASILEILDDPRKFLGDLESIRKAYSPDTVAAEYEKLFEDLIGKK
jgi:glycosyltransferase involved in cell wall biosynthesis